MDEVQRVLTSAQVREMGMTPWTARASGLVIPRRGVWAAREAVTLREAVAEIAAVLDGEWAVCGWDAAELIGLPRPRPWQPGDPVHVCVPTSAARPRRRGLVAHRGLERRRAVLLDGVPVTVGIHVVSDVAALAGTTHDDLVRLGDAFLHLGGPADQLVAIASRTRRGVTRLRDALGDIRHGAESPKETDLRLLAVRAGLPEPELQVRLLDEAGCPVCRFDLYWEDYALGGEFDGDHHRVERLRWLGDRTADRRAQGLGHRRVRFVASDLWRERRGETAEALRQLMTRPPLPPRGRLVRTVPAGPIVR